MSLIIVDKFDTYEHKPARPKADLRGPRMLRARYDAAQTSDENSNHWAQADYLSPDASLLPEVRRKLRARARYEFSNNTYCNGMVRTLANDTIGTGPTLQLLSGDKDADLQAENAFWKWCQRVRWAEKLQIMRMAWARDGETFATFFTNYALRSAVKLDFRVYESDQVASPTMTLGPESVTDGVYFDDFGNVAAYTLLKQHPGDSYQWLGINDYEIIPAADMIHLLNRDRPGQSRGVPEITPALPLYAQLRRYTLAVIAAAETAADIAGVVQSMATATDPDEVEPLDAIDIARRQLLTMPKGWGIQQLKAEQPTTTYEMFKRAILSEIARCLNMPYNVAAGDSSGYNYSSGRLDHKTYYKSLRVSRSYVENECLDRILERWWEEAALRPGVLPESLRNLPEPPPHEWRWDGDEHVDPTKEATAVEIKLRTGQTSLPDEAARQGTDFEALQQKQARALGITVAEYQKRLADYLYGPAQQAAPAEPPQEEEEDATDE